jgi:uncharacterized membrane protein YkvA (DUF1232 family)
MAGAEQQIQTLQRFVNSFAADAGTLRTALRDAATPAPARRVLVGALNYVLDALDIFPDHYKGLGLADDALVFRVAAAQAVAAGCRHDGVVHLAADHDETADILGDVAKPFETFVAKLAERTVRGRTGDKVLADGDTSAMFHADLDRELVRHVTSQITPGIQGAAGVISELRKMSKHALKKAGIQ